MYIKLYKGFNLSDIYVGLTILYNLQDILYPSGIISQLIQLIIILWGIIYTIPYISRFPDLPLILKAATLLILMYGIYGLIEMLFPREIYLGDELRPPYIYIQNALNSFLPIFVFYSFFKRRQLSSRRLGYYAYIFFIFFVIRYFHTIFELREQALLFNSSIEEFTNNSSYSFVYLIPFLFFIRKTLIKFVILAACATFILMGMKRGAIIIGFIAIVWLLYSQIRSKSRSRNYAIFLSIIFITSALWYVQRTMATSDYFIKRIEQTKEGNSSNRDILYGDLLHEINTDSSLVHFFFGRGANSSILISGNYAHQDWLELMTNNGLLGVCLGIFFYYSIFKTAYKYRGKLGKTYYTIFILVGILTFIPTLFSMIIYQLPTTITIMLGFLTGYTQRKKRCRDTKESLMNKLIMV